jgi:hypothetical protein
VVPTIVALVGYGVAFFLLSLILAPGLPVALVYGIWSAVGVLIEVGPPIRPEGCEREPRRRRHARDGLAGGALRGAVPSDAPSLM